MWASHNVDRPRIARVYDYLLGGVYGFGADREAAEKLIEAVPEAPAMARLNRAFLGRAVKYCLDIGITQFLDLGSGLPSRGNVHEVVRKHNPEARVLYVDNDPVVVMHCQLAVKDNEKASAVYADLRRPETVLSAPASTELFDLTKPVCLLMGAVLHLISDDENPAHVIEGYHHRLEPGSHLVISHPSQAPKMRRVAGLVQREHITAHAQTRSRAEVKRLLGQFELVVPGVTWIENWRPEPKSLVPNDMPANFLYGAVGRKL